MPNPTRAGLAALAVLAIAPSAAHALAEVSFEPKRIHADDRVKISFEAERTVKKGFHLEYVVLASEGSIFECTTVKTVQTRKRPKKGDQVTKYLDGSSGLGTQEWCVGKNSVFVNYRRNSDNKGGKWIAFGEFRVRP
jgi:hypothetical protein